FQLQPSHDDEVTPMNELSKDDAVYILKALRPIGERIDRIGYGARRLNSCYRFLKRIDLRTEKLGYVRRLDDGTLALDDPRSNTVDTDEGQMSARFVITDNTPDRVGDVIDSRGIYLENFKKNPIALYGHNSNMYPIGKWEDPAGKCTIR